MGDAALVAAGFEQVESGQLVRQRFVEAPQRTQCPAPVVECPGKGQLVTQFLGERDRPAGHYDGFLGIGFEQGRGEFGQRRLELGIRASSFHFPASCATVCITA